MNAASGLGSARAVAQRFGCDPIELVVLTEGHINDSYLVRTGSDEYVLQRINRSVFPDAEAVSSNILAVHRHLGGRLVPDPVPAPDGGWLLPRRRGDLARLAPGSLGPAVHRDHARSRLAGGSPTREIPRRPRRLRPGAARRHARRLPRPPIAPRRAPCSRSRPILANGPRVPVPRSRRHSTQRLSSTSPRTWSGRFRSGSHTMTPSSTTSSSGRARLYAWSTSTR